MPEHDTYDSPWKAVLRRFLRPCMELFLPKVAGEIAWERGSEFLDKELESLAPDAEHGPRVVDLLVKVYLRSGAEAWIVIHVEVQASPETAFARRMLVYHYRIFDRHRKPVLSLAILADNQPSWRPDHFETGAFGTSLRLQFLTVKLLDWVARRAELERSRNPFASVVLAHLDALRTKGAPERRLARKWSLTRRLFQRGYNRRQILSLFSFLDEVLRLPKPLEIQFRDRLARYQESQHMPYITSIERLAREEGEAKGREEGRQEGREEGHRQGLVAGLHAAVLSLLEARFGHVPPPLVTAIEALEDPSTLDRLVRSAALAASLDVFEAELPRR